MGRRSHARQLLIVGVAVGILVAPLLLRCLAGFALPASRGRPSPTPVSKRLERRARDDMPRHVLEVPVEEEEEEEVDVYRQPEKRIPYTINFFSTPPRSHDSATWKYMERKLNDALQVVEDWVQQVDVRLAVEESKHKPVSGRHHNVQEQQHIKKHSYDAYAPVVDEEDVVSPSDEAGAYPTDLLAERRQLAPYRLDVSVKMRHGTMVLSKPRHAQGTFLEAVDHMHDTLKRMMIKEKEKRVDRRRRHRAHRREQSPYDSADEKLTAAEEMALWKSGMEPDF
eukprot:TRINITY_DN12827_c1_g1_i2.p1 TRINITY_DN12827_c1_g1~~TRINITY_DN12827_c1_g1_i2.p1  ORF type:complete len:282 (-),score=82.37 TRINITY_DN12827_c1_g1_i2:681-1526(-)